LPYNVVGAAVGLRSISVFIFVAFVVVLVWRKSKKHERGALRTSCVTSSRFRPLAFGGSADRSPVFGSVAKTFSISDLENIIDKSTEFGRVARTSTISTDLDIRPVVKAFM
jgi:hypothetical protein